MLRVFFVVFMVLVPSFVFCDEGIKIFGVDLAYLVQLLIALILVIFGIYSISWVSIKKRIEKFTESQFNDNKISQILFTLTEICVPIVANLQQEYVESWKKASADGKLTQEEIVQLNEKALLHLKEAAKTLINDLSKVTDLTDTNLDNLLLGIIRKVVENSKKGF